MIGASNSENHDGRGKKCYYWIKAYGRNIVSLIVVTTNSATFIFGGQGGRKTYEYLPKQSDTWLPGQTEIPDGFQNGSALAVRSEQEIWLIGGYNTESRILSFNVKDHTFVELTVKLNVGRWGHRSAFIPGTNKILITGGKDNQRKAPYSGAGNVQSSTEILDTEDETITMGSSMLIPKAQHGIGVVTCNDENRLQWWPKNVKRLL